MAFWRAVNVARGVQAQTPLGPFFWTPGGLSPSYSLLLHTLSWFLRDHTAVLNAALFLHTLPTRFCFSLHSQQFVNIPCLFLVIDSMNWFHLGKEGWWEKKREGYCGWWSFFDWYHGCLSLFFYHGNRSLSFTSLSGMFLFFKWLLASSLAAVSSWWNEHIKRCAALTKRCGLAGWLAPAFCCKAPAEVTGWQQRAPRHKRAVSAAVEWAGQ